MLRALPVMLLLIVACSPNASDDPVVPIEADDVAMNAAIAEARATVNEFTHALEEKAPGDSDFAVKAPIHDGEAVEHFWLIDISYSEGRFTGTINNTPQSVSNVKEGQPYEISESEISDWMFFRNGVAIGNRTLRVLFPRMPDEEVAAVKEMLGWE